ncbi:Hypothetical Protein FCC1311_014392 [Hondaea fermentalgiana]|uniref:Uncharacterized protein n=1 Tax=Hondaea fermentalgiana TaxID=2315210 RepID=A0A2R5G2J7_9STRA|nr:Hypothetical Protein FCC1311_014392 [Hondaea fermentalgiana]|eukprot:GBG25222.1 Hypothetical Protein FCC1311_014392 [Hondaea fermentalgiana]
MTQGLDRRLRYMERSRKEPLPWLRHKLYLLRLWTGAYVLDDWETVLLLVMFLATMYFTFSFFGGASLSESFMSPSAPADVPAMAEISN